MAFFCKVLPTSVLAKGLLKAAVSPFSRTLQAWVHDFYTNGLTDLIELDRHVFGAPLRRDLLHRVVVWQRDLMRQGTHSTKNRSEVSGTSRKVFPQKGRGKARMRSRRAPQWRGGGRAFGPHPRSHRTDLQRKVREFGLRSAISSKYMQDQLVIVNDLILNSHKTKYFIDVLHQHSWDKLVDERKSGHSILFITTARTRNFELACRNIKTVDYFTVQEILEASDVYNILRHEAMVIDRAAVTEFELLLKPDESPFIVKHINEFNSTPSGILYPQSDILINPGNFLK
ncbi:hypothetical protein G9A89_014312 [Geosiphon pyriformis]|nr:hypothetical protein G9A89_014312 [Geosiphon pyriformis]